LSQLGAVKFYYYGISQFEIEVIYSTLKWAFGVVDEQQLPLEENDFVSMVEIEFPIPFGEEFFQILTIERWHKIKGLIKEMKRRRGGKKGVKAFISFCGVEPGVRKPRLTFSFMNKNSRHFEMAIEKIEYLVDVIPLQLQMIQKSGNTLDEVSYIYDENSFKWNPHMAKSSNGSEHYYVQKTKEWIQKP
jgi:hypothetical protein